jgi:hypothetical protein
MIQVDVIQWHINRFLFICLFHFGQKKEKLFAFVVSNLLSVVNNWVALRQRMLLIFLLPFGT